MISCYSSVCGCEVCVCGCEVCVWLWCICGTCGHMCANKTEHMCLCACVMLCHVTVTIVMCHHLLEFFGTAM